jgi:hypothetical protein
MNKGTVHSGTSLPHIGPEAERFLAFFDSMQDVFEQAAAGPEKVNDRYLGIAGYLIRMRFAGSALFSSLIPAFHHLAVMPSASVDLTVCLFDSTGRGRRLPPPPWSWDGIIARGDIRNSEGNRIGAAFQLGAGILSLFDRERGRAIFWIDDARRLPFHELATPLRTILHWFMAGHEKQFIHGAAVGNEAGGVLIAGRGGSGKSTVALACLLQGMDYAGDDCVLIEHRPRPHVFGLYGTAMLESRQVARFPRLCPAVGRLDRDGKKKLMMFLRPLFPGQLSAGFPLRAIFLSRFSGRYRTVLKEVSAADVFAAMAPSTMAVLPGAGERDFRYIGAFIRQLPNFVLETGSDMAGIGRTVSRFLKAN